MYKPAGKEHDTDKIESDTDIVSAAKALHVYIACKYTLQTAQLSKYVLLNYHTTVLLCCKDREVF
jgi:hypothetical protein